MRYYALKSIVKDHVVEQREIKHTIDEQDILSSLSHINHPFIAKLHASFQDEFRLYLVTDYYCGGDLATHMARLYSFPKHCALVYAAEIIEGIGELHRLGILYRDLKPENILIDGDGHIVLTDFGLSKWLTESNGFCTQTFCGTAEYLAPEVLLGEEYSFGVDHWSFGTILYEMLTGVPPFWAENHPEMYRRIMQDSLEFPNNIADYETTEFLTFVLDKDPITRLGANGTQEIKSHAFFADIDWVALRHRHIEPLYIPASSDFLDFSNFDPDFLSMDPTLTPAPSEINLILELQDIFEDYCFTDETYADEEYSIADIDQLPVVSKSSLEKNPEILQDIDSTLVSRPSLKRGSFSMLSYENELYTESSQNNSNNESNINTSNSPKSLFNDSVQKEETSRHAKRRNTSILENHFSLIEDTLNKKMTDTDNCTKAKKEKICDESSLGSFEFSNLPDLRFAFSLNNASSQSTRNTIKTVKRSKSTRRNKIRNFFSFVL
jgi:serine/threonine protein kinase